MSSATIINTFKNMIENIEASFKLVYLYYRRHNPVREMISTVQKSINDLLTANKKMRVHRYRVNHYKYRLNQMEKLINDNNPYNFKGSSINQVR